MGLVGCASVAVVAWWSWGLSGAGGWGLHVLYSDEDLGRGITHGIGLRYSGRCM